MGNVLGIVTGIGMACGPPLIYADQAWSIIKKKDSTGFSMDVCAVLILSNLMRCVFWLGSRFEIALLMQSINLILAMLVLLYILLKYRKTPPASDKSSSPRPLNFWQWPKYGQYIEFLAAFIIILCTSYILLGGYSWFVDTLGFVALGLESQLPTPQAISNFQRKSTYGLRISTLGGWLGGDLFKCAYFFFSGAPKQFIICGLITVTIDCIIVAQRVIYGIEPPEGEGGENGSEGGDEEEARGLTERDRDEGEDERR